MTSGRPQDIKPAVATLDPPTPMTPAHDVQTDFLDTIRDVAVKYKQSVGSREDDLAQQLAQEKKNSEEKNRRIKEANDRNLALTRTITRLRKERSEAQAGRTKAEEDNQRLVESFQQLKNSMNAIALPEPTANERPSVAAPSVAPQLSLTGTAPLKGRVPPGNPRPRRGGYTRPPKRIQPPGDEEGGTNVRGGRSGVRLSSEESVWEESHSTVMPSQSGDVGGSSLKRKAAFDRCWSPLST